jgi:hypothetical protein
LFVSFPYCPFRFINQTISFPMRVKTKARNQGTGAQDDANTETSQDKTQARRAQVRKAQVQHRQRKANYVKQLEMDVARIREMIEAAEQDTKSLLDENKAMRAQILQAMSKKAAPLTLDQGVHLLQEMPQPSELSDVGKSLQQGIEDVTITLGFDEIMNAPTFYVSSPPPPSRHAHQLSPQESYPTDNSFPDLTPEQTQAAINFILAYVALSDPSHRRHQRLTNNAPASSTSAARTSTHPTTPHHPPTRSTRPLSSGTKATGTR